MASWQDVGTIAVSLPGVTAGQAHEGSPAYDVAGRQFARLRWEADREILQFWTPDAGARESLVQSDPETYWVTKAFASAIFAWLDRLDVTELQELLTDSWLTRAPKHVTRKL